MRAYWGIDLPAQELLDDRAPKPHCQTCGRFISARTVCGGGGPDLNGDYADVFGWCSTCGSVHVSWVLA